MHNALRGLNTKDVATDCYSPYLVIFRFKWTVRITITKVINLDKTTIFVVKSQETKVTR